MINWTKDIVDCSGEARLVSGKYRRNSIAAGETHNEHYYDSYDCYDSYEGRQNRTEGQTVSAIMSQLIKLMSIFGVYICVRKFEKFLK